jgi:hypothetical protein
MTAPNFGALDETLDVARNNVGLGSGGPRLIQLGVKPRASPRHLPTRSTNTVMPFVRCCGSGWGRLA